ncbi:MAG: M20/M25/M40 family metallo-hydrolase [Verrucomicrobia bacterium]|nr:M20/M25/M40 family metallo-hydrolase [Verrucomicrobiota bacterium]
MWRDEAGNVIGLVKGKQTGNPLRLMAHKDEIAYVVKRIDADGKIRLDEVGSLPPWKLGETPVDILTRNGLVKGVFSIGSLHISEETQRIRGLLKDKPLLLKDTWVNTGLTKERLEKLGVYPGVRVVVAREMKNPLIVNDCVCGYNLDDKGGVAILLMVMEKLRQKKMQINRDIYFVATSMEEVGTIGAPFAAGKLPGTTTVALEAGPVAEEYGSKLDERPIIWYGPNAVYEKKGSDALLDLARKLRFGAQPIYYWGAGTDAASSKIYGLSGRALCLSFPCENTHGYEMAHIEGMLNTATLTLEAISKDVFP